MLAESPLQPDVLIAGGNNAEIFITEDSGKHWKNANKELLAHLKITSITPSKFDKNRVYITLNDYNHDDAKAYVYVSNDMCNSWKLITSNLPIEATHIIAEDPKDENILYLGTDLGVYVSLNRGGDWMSLSTALPPIATQDLLVHPEENELIIATHGRSMYAMDVRPIRKYSELQKEQFAYLFSVKTARLPRMRHASGDWDTETMRPAKFTFYLPERESIEIDIVDENGSSVWSLSDSFGKGFHTVSWDMIKEVSKTVNSAYFRGTQYHEAGRYKVEVKVGQTVLSEEFTVTQFSN